MPRRIRQLNSASPSVGTPNPSTQVIIAVGIDVRSLAVLAEYFDANKKATCLSRPAKAMVNIIAKTRPDLIQKYSSVAMAISEVSKRFGSISGLSGGMLQRSFSTLAKAVAEEESCGELSEMDLQFLNGLESSGSGDNETSISASISGTVSAIDMSTGRITVKREDEIDSLTQKLSRDLELLNQEQDQTTKQKTGRKTKNGN